VVHAADCEVALMNRFMSMAASYLARSVTLDSSPAEALMSRGGNSVREKESPLVA
jgi:hypothetical protein